jgi:hypothetical protein
MAPFGYENDSLNTKVPWAKVGLATRRIRDRAWEVWLLGRGRMECILGREVSEFSTALRLC